MITINNKTVGWALIIITVSIPWVLLLCGLPMYTPSKYGSSSTLSALGFIIVVELSVIGIMIAGFILHILCRLFDKGHNNPIKFEWKIRVLPKFTNKVKSLDTETRNLLIDYGRSEVGTSENRAIFEELDRRGIWG